MRGSKCPRASATAVAAGWHPTGGAVRGACFGSLVDNFEWAEGWGARFGLLQLDPVTQERTPRPSAAVYAAIARANGLSRDLVAAIAPDLTSALFA